VISITSLAGYEVLTEGRGSNAGTCIINLKDWKDRSLTSRQIIEELEEACHELTDVKLEFFEPPAVPGFGTAGGFSLVCLDKSQSSVADYKRLGDVTDDFMSALRERPEVKNLFTFYTSNYPQYELVINTDVLYQKGLTTETVLNNLNIQIGSTYEQGFIRFNQFYKVYVQAWPQFPGHPGRPRQHVRHQRRRGAGALLGVHVDGEEAGPQRDHALQPLSVVPSSRARPLRATAAARRSPPSRRSPRRNCRAATHRLGVCRTTSRGSGNEALYIFLIVVAFVYLVLVAQYESFLLPLAVILSLPIGIFGSFAFLT
jgi:HAE1 family hydrophobic/amphiphilic exporter-1